MLTLSETGSVYYDTLQWYKHKPVKIVAAECSSKHLTSNYTEQQPCISFLQDPIKRRSLWFSHLSLRHKITPKDTS